MRQVELFEMAPDGGTLYENKACLYEYDANGRMSKEYVYDNRNRLQTYKTFEWNQFGKKKVQYTYNAKGKLLSVKHYEYLAQDAGE